MEQVGVEVKEGICPQAWHLVVAGEEDEGLVRAESVLPGGNSGRCRKGAEVGADLASDTPRKTAIRGQPIDPLAPKEDPFPSICPLRASPPRRGDGKKCTTSPG